MGAKKTSPGTGGLLNVVPSAAGGSARLPVLGQAPAAEERADAARNRERILLAARKLLGRRCISSLSMDDVADAAGVGKGTLYRRFKDRASLCHALLDDEERRLQDRVIAGLELSPWVDAHGRLHALTRALAAFVLDNAALLANAQAHHAGQVEWFDHPTRAWRRFELSRAMRAMPAWKDATPLRLQAASDAVLAVLDANQAVWLRQQGASDQDILEVWMSVALGACGA